MAMLVTGGTGYIGAHTSVELLNAGYDIVLLDNFANSKPEVMKRIRDVSGKNFSFYHVDLLDEEKLDQVFAQHEIEAVIHLAALKAVGESARSPLRYYRNNIVATMNLLDTMCRYNVKKLIFSSSATVYGLQYRMPISEEVPLNAANPYGRTKLIIEDMLRDLFASDEQWSVILLRYFNPVGAHHSGRLGEDPNGIPNNLTPFITQVAVGKLNEMKVYGNNYPTPDGTGVRDYIHVVDLALGHVKSIDKVLSGKGVKAYNLGTGVGYSVLEMIQAFEKVSGRKIPYSVVDRRAGDVAVCYADPSKAQRELGWVAVRGLEEMCADAWRWQRQNPDGYEISVDEAMAAR